MKDPVERIKWRDAETLNANDYNPNVVIDQEMKLLEYSILKSGWIQPILISEDGVIIDGFHRYYLSLNSSKLRERYKGQVPCVVMDIDEKERMMLTIRINRAKGNHIAAKMADIIKQLINEHGCSIKEVAEGIGAKKPEIDLLLKEGVFDAKNIKEYKYSQAWDTPK